MDMKPGNFDSDDDYDKATLESDEVVPRVYKLAQDKIKTQSKE